MTAADIRVMPVLTRATEALREKITAYVDAMNYTERPVQGIVVFAEDYDATLGAINRHRNKGHARDEVKPDPITQLTWGGGSGNSGSPLRKGALIA